MVTLAVRNTFAGTDLVENDPLNENLRDVETRLMVALHPIT